MKTLVRIPGAVLAVAALAVVAFAVQPFTLKRTPKAGEVSKYKLSVETEIQGMNISFGGDVIEKITEVKANGEFVVESSQENVKVKFGDQEQEMPSGGSTKTVYRPDGSVVEITGEQTDANAYRLANLNGFRYPTNPLNAGDKWEIEIKADPKSGSVAAKGTFEVVGAEKVGNWDAVKIKYSVVETEGSEPATAEGTTWISTVDGNMIKTEGSWKNAPIAGAPAPINAKFTLERVS